MRSGNGMMIYRAFPPKGLLQCVCVHAGTSEEDVQELSVGY